MRLPINRIIEVTGSQVLVEPRDASCVATALTWDSRTVKPGCVYVALEGERVDGHAFIAQAAKAGAVAVLATHALDDETRGAAQAAGCAVLQVADATEAISQLAAEWRGHLSGKVIGLTGSSGKTTTKNLVRDVLSAHFSVTATAGNQNNELGVPNTLLAAGQSDGAVVVEMGMRGMGQIAQLCDFVHPEWGLMVNVGTSHMELLGSRDNIAKAKGELLCALPAGGWAFINGADDYASYMREETGLDERGVHVAVYDGSEAAPAASAGVCKPGDARVWAESISFDGAGHPRFMLCAQGFPAIGGTSAGVQLQDGDSRPDGVSEIERVECTLELRGAHNVGNACAAAAVGRAAGMSLAAIADALASAQPETGRQQVLKRADGALVINDSYNANPDSMGVALEMFGAMEVAGRRIAVLGDMGELGAYSDEGHKLVGKRAAAAGVDVLVCVGELACGIAQGARDAGFAEDGILFAEDAAQALRVVAPLVAPEDAVLVKASHSVGLELVAEGLVA